MLLEYKTKRNGKRFISLLCFLVLFFAGIFANNQSDLKAGGVEAAAAASVRQDGNAKLQEILKTARETDKLASTPSIWPISGTVTSRFGWRTSPWGGGNEFHAGIDIANTIGTPVVAAADGKVVQSAWDEGYGNFVQIDHGNGIITIYGHNSRNNVSIGQNVKKGQVISYLGSTGRSTGPHVHYEVRVNDQAVDPIRFMAIY